MVPQNASFVRIKPLFFLVMLIQSSLPIRAQLKNTGIQINQLGFYPNAPKLAVVTEKTNSSDFHILSPNLKDTFYSGKLSDERLSAYSATKTRIANFSIFQLNGKYVLSTGKLISYPFEINDAIISKAANASLKAFYFQNLLNSVLPTCVKP